MMPSSKSKKTFRSDHHRRQTQVRLVGAGFLILIGTGGGLVWLLYGGSAAVMAVVCLLGGAGIFGLLWLILTLLELWVKDEAP